MLTYLNHLTYTLDLDIGGQERLSYSSEVAVEVTNGYV